MFEEERKSNSSYPSDTLIKASNQDHQRQVWRPRTTGLVTKTDRSGVQQQEYEHLIHELLSPVVSPKFQTEYASTA